MNSPLLNFLENELPKDFYELYPSPTGSSTPNLNCNCLSTGFRMVTRNQGLTSTPETGREKT